MSEYGEIFSTDVPGTKKRTAARTVKPVAEPEPAKTVKAVTEPEPAPAITKRKYTRKAAPGVASADDLETGRIVPPVEVPQDATAPAVVEPAVPREPQDIYKRGVITPVPETALFSSYALEYLAALERLLALIGEPQRTKLVDFIVDNSIV